MGLVGEGQGTASGTKEDTLPNWGSSRVPLLTGLNPSGLVSVLCLFPSKDKPSPTGRYQYPWRLRCGGQGQQKGRGGHRMPALPALIRGYLLTSLLPAVD